MPTLSDVGQLDIRYDITAEIEEAITKPNERFAHLANMEQKSNKLREALPPVRCLESVSMVFKPMSNVAYLIPLPKFENAVLTAFYPCHSWSYAEISLLENLLFLKLY